MVNNWRGDMSTYPIILGQPFFIATQIKTRVLDDAYARIKNWDGKRAIQFLTIGPNHDSLEDQLLPKVNK